MADTAPAVEDRGHLLAVPPESPDILGGPKMEPAKVDATFGYGGHAKPAMGRRGRKGKMPAGKPAPVTTLSPAQEQYCHEPDGEPAPAKEKGADIPTPASAKDYRAFIARRTQSDAAFGFAPLWMPPGLFDFQETLIDWAVRRGRGALFEGCGLGKSVQQLTFAENVVRKTNRPALVLTPLAVGHQTIREAEKFGMEAVRSMDGKFKPGARIVVTNYERLHYFDPQDFAAVVPDESSILKDSDGKTRDAVIEFMRTRPYRLPCTATAAPNDYDELGNTSEALGELGYADMLTMFFKQETKKDLLGWGHTKYRLKGHAETGFWRWVVSWARAIRSPADLGFDDGPFLLPPLETEQHVVESASRPDGFLFDVPAVTLQEQQAERRRTLRERCKKVADLVNHDRPALCWCQLNPEGDLLEDLIPGAAQVKGSMPDEEKEEILEAFASGQVLKLVTKPSIAGRGLNWQHCAHQTFFPSHSFEDYYQAVRRCWRFGQKNPVKVDVVTTKGEERVLANLRRKADAADAMFSRLVELMGDQLRVTADHSFPKKAEVPSWLKTLKSA